MATEETQTGASTVEEHEPLAQYEMTRDEYDSKMRAVTLGKSDKMPDGTPLKEVHANIAKMESEQEEKLANHVIKTVTDVVGEPEASDKVRVTTSMTGVDAVDPVLAHSNMEPPKPAAATPGAATGSADGGQKHNLPSDLPSKDKLLAADVTKLDTVAQMTEVDLKSIGLTDAEAAKVIAYIDEATKP